MSDSISVKDKLDAIRIVQNYIYGLRESIEESHKSYAICTDILGDLIDLKISLGDEE
jgi:hypothetical protein